MNLLQRVDLPIEPVGLTEDGVVDPSALAQAHATALEGRSYTLTFDLVVKNADRSLRSYFSMDLSLSATRQYLARVSKAGPEGPRFLGEPPASAEYWSDGETYMVNYSSGRTESFTEYQPPGGLFGKWQYWGWRLPFGGTIPSRLGDYSGSVFNDIPTRLIERDIKDGLNRYRVGTDGRNVQPETTLGEPDISDILSVRLDAIIDERNLVESFELRFLAERNCVPVDVHRTLDYADLGETTVDRPVWVG